ncbi:hypothetical protein NQ314_021386 [Rhamnusium bicolor]|uniref:Integrase SAM-like N-terminal domain-containing protein n=1 Tax=Rhamnusium bicolor TaxID=1586634 RepID=A0AAV8WJA8_9CUCU|nr:hypothetical protein NQ314_021386 [Rhamnusium bicolor]
MSRFVDRIKEHIQSIPRVESHYCRAETEREYIEGTKTIADLHRDYQESCKNENIPSATYRTYYDVFTREFNIAFHFPKKDQCDLCLEFHNTPADGKSFLQERYEHHLREKDLSPKERKNDIDSKIDRYL